MKAELMKDSAQAMKRNYYVSGVAPVAIASVLWAISFALRKLISESIGPFTITLIGSLAGALTLAIVFQLKPTVVWKLGRSNIWKIFSLSILSVTVGSAAMVAGLGMTTLSAAVVVEKTQPIFAVILSYVLLKERLDPAALALIVVGLAFSAAFLWPTRESTAVVSLSMQLGVAC